MDCIIEPIEVMTALGNHSLPEYILPEQYQTRGTQHLSYLLHAIRQRQKVHFLYRKYADNTRSERTLSPYALKEWRGRWYVLGAEESGKIKTFGLDRIEQLIEQALAAQVAGDGKMPAHARIDADELGKLGDETRGQVVDAKVAHVLEHMHGLCAARSGHPGDDDDIGDTLRALRRIHGISLLHVLPPKNKRGTQQPGSHAVNCLY